MCLRRRCCSPCIAHGCRACSSLPPVRCGDGRQRPRVWQVVAVGNGGAMTLYLWHIPAIAVAMFSLHAVGLDAYDVHAHELLGPARSTRTGVRGRHGGGVLAALTARASHDCRGGTIAFMQSVPGRPSLVRLVCRRGSRARASGQERARRQRRHHVARVLPRRGSRGTGERLELQPSFFSSLDSSVTFRGHGQHRKSVKAFAVRCCTGDSATMLRCSSFDVK